MAMKLVFILYQTFMKKYLAEMFGVLFFVLIIGLSGGNALTVGLALAVLVYATGPLSGGHLNPAVTLSLAVAKKISWGEATKYWLWQIIGALVGALIYRAIKDSTMLVMPADGVSTRQILAGEFIFAFMLAMVVYLTAVAKKAAGNSYWGLAI
ncbi:aquaporin [Patescibacteria group bacterium]|nr:aquaporin [Patescibacteria group bacterium]